MYLSSRSRNSKNSESEPTSQESEVPSLEATNKARQESDLRELGNKLFKEGKYQPAIQKYEEAVKSGRCSLEDKVKCYRFVSILPSLLDFNIDL